MYNNSSSFLNGMEALHPFRHNTHYRPDLAHVNLNFWSHRISFLTHKRQAVRDGKILLLKNDPHIERQLGYSLKTKNPIRAKRMRLSGKLFTYFLMNLISFCSLP